MARTRRENDSFKNERAVERALQGVMNLGATLAQIGGGRGGSSSILAIDEGFPDARGAVSGEWICGDKVGTKTV